MSQNNHSLCVVGETTPAAPNRSVKCGDRVVLLDGVESVYEFFEVDSILIRGELTIVRLKLPGSHIDKIMTLSEFFSSTMPYREK